MENGEFLWEYRLASYSPDASHRSFSVLWYGALESYKGVMPFAGIGTMKKLSTFHLEKCKDYRVAGTAGNDMAGEET